MVQTARLSRRLWVARNVRVWCRAPIRMGRESERFYNSQHFTIFLMVVFLTGRRYPFVVRFHWVVNEFGDEVAPSRPLRRVLRRE